MNPLYENNHTYQAKQSLYISGPRRYITKLKSLLSKKASILEKLVKKSKTTVL